MSIFGQDAPKKPALSGPALLLRSFGIDPGEIMQQYEQMKIALPMFAANIKQSVDDMNARLTRIEQKLDTLISRDENFDRLLQAAEIATKEKDDTPIVIVDTDSSSN